MDWLKILVLGIVEGVTEFLPISSTGHLIVARTLLNYEFGRDGTFEIFIQLGAVIAVLLYYRADLWSQVQRFPSDPGVRRLWGNIVIASVPAGVLALALHDWITDTLFHPLTVALALIVGGVVFLLVERQHTEPEVPVALEAITSRQALLIGLAQMTALIPGVSRSGASIIGGMLTGINRETATRFSFYLAIPLLGAATLIELALSLDEIAPNALAQLLFGALVSGIVAWVSIGWLMRYVGSHSFAAFGWYRILAGGLILVLLALGVL